MITPPLPDDNDDPTEPSAAGHYCFYCGEHLLDPAVLWTGEDGHTVFLHAICTLEWTQELIAEAVEIREGAP